MVKRLFLGVPVSQSLATELTGIQKRWQTALDLNLAHSIPAEKFHLTLHFFGEVHLGKASRYLDIFSSRSFGQKCSIWLNRGLAFPNLQNPKVLVLAGSEGLSPLSSLVHQLTIETEKLGSPRESRVFVPHITLFRTRAITKLKDIPKVSPVLFKIESFALYESRLTPQGSHYEILKNWELS